MKFDRERNNCLFRVRDSKGFLMLNEEKQKIPGTEGESRPWQMKFDRERNNCLFRVRDSKGFLMLNEEKQKIPGTEGESRPWQMKLFNIIIKYD